MAKKSEETGARKRKAAAPKAAPERKLEPKSAPKSASKTRKSRVQGEDVEPAVKPLKAKAKSSTAKSSAAKAMSVSAEAKSASAKSESSAAKKRTTKPKIKRATKELEDSALPIREPVVDPIGDVSDGEGHAYLGDLQDSELEPEMAAYRADTADDAIEGTLEARSEHPSGAEPTPDAEDKTGPAAHVDLDEADEAIEADASLAAGPRPPAKLERLQKILSQAGIASRRHAEEMIQTGRVMVNGQVVTQLGAKADAAHDHIRVDGKMITGAERHRYFVLNKPKGFVTTVSDPEGRPTVMQFFSKISERLYPVGRLDYDSEGLLLVTNDGSLANQLTRAASGIEKTYLVKVAGRPTEDELEQLRSGVAIEREGPGSGKVHTAPAQIRQVRQGDNPWYEVVLTEGRNRELRKMFQSIGHFVEKIRRVGYGPLVLDLEPGKLRELTPEEISKLRLAAEGKWKPRPPRTDVRSRSGAANRSKPGKMFPREAGQRVERTREREQDRRGGDRFQERAGGEFRQREFGPRKFGQRDFSQRDSGQPKFGEPRPGQFGKKPLSRQGEGGRPFRDQLNRGEANRNQGNRDWANRNQTNRNQPGRDQSSRGSSGWKPREERPGARSGEQQRSFRGRPEFGSGRGPRFEDRPHRDGDKPRHGNFGQGNFGSRRSEFGDRPPRGDSQGQRRSEGWKRDSEQRGNRGDRGPRGRGDSERTFRGSFGPASGERRAPNTREGDRDGAGTPRGFAPGRFSKPGGNRPGFKSGFKSGFKGRPGGDNRGGPPRGGRGRG
ncbi:MAG TPA: pseudouridine synthase [Terracidiphilus sp.]|nr:pseudouridine synthase [Terracidiphilus sp.]